MVRPRLVAHRGYALRYPENTLIAYEAAIAAGARFVECDVQLTRDEQPVLFHDHTMERLCGHSGAIHELTLEELSAFHASEPDKFGYRFAQNPVTQLSELVTLLQAHPGVTAFVEIKRNSLERFGISAVLSAIEKTLQPVQDQCVLISYGLKALMAARKHGWPAIGAVIDDWAQRNHESVKKLQPQFFFCDIDSLPRRGLLDANGMRVAVYECTDAEKALAVAQRGIEFVETFAIGEMLAAMELLLGEDDRKL